MNQIRDALQMFINAVDSWQDDGQPQDSSDFIATIETTAENARNALAAPIHCPDCARDSGIPIPAQPCPHACATLATMRATIDERTRERDRESAAHAASQRTINELRADLIELQDQMRSILARFNAGEFDACGALECIAETLK